MSRHHMHATIITEGLIVRGLHHLYKLNEVYVVKHADTKFVLINFYDTHRVWSGKSCRSDETSPSADTTTLARSAR